MAVVRFQMVNPTKQTSAINNPPTAQSTNQSLISICTLRKGTIIIMAKAGNRSNDLSIATVGNDRLMGRAAMRLSMSAFARSEEHTSELQSHLNLVCRLLLEKKKTNNQSTNINSTP